VGRCLSQTRTWVRQEEIRQPQVGHRLFQGLPGIAAHAFAPAGSARGTSEGGAAERYAHVVGLGSCWPWAPPVVWGCPCVEQTMA
jgi:hypothetical protein